MTHFLSDLIHACEHEVQGNPVGHSIDNLEYNSRKANSNSLFFCMPGARVDGHDFAEQAYINGCRAFVVERFLTLPEDAVQIKVSCSREALSAFSARFYNDSAKRITLIGITGTKGKTTTAIMIQEILCSNGIRCAYIGSNGVIIGDKHYNTVNTTPESRELHYYFSVMEQLGITHAVMEVSSQALNNYRVAGLQFDTVIFTNLSSDHIGPGEHASFEEYRDAKRKLFFDYGAKNIVYNMDDPAHSYFIAGSKADLISFSLNENSVFSASNIRQYRDETSLGIDFDIALGGIKTPVRLRTPGKFSVYNGLAAISAAYCCGISVENSAKALAGISVRGRFEIVSTPIDGVTFIIDYAHNGLSLTDALQVLSAYKPKRLICVFGSVGGRTYVRRREMAEAASAHADFSVITSDNPDFEDPESVIDDILKYFDRSKLYTTIPDREEAVRFAVRIAEKGDIVLFAGKGHEDYQLIEGVKVSFSEKAIIMDEAIKVSEGITVK